MMNVTSWFGDEEAERRRRMDEARMGSHRGKGPRGYKRSDERIQEDVNERLTDYDALDASDIEVVVNSGNVIQPYGKPTSSDSTVRMVQIY
ncbi:MAG TPA: hypothetical protein VJ023_20140 [Pyrinomonadaceae bacterium]|nr:hypothetical protein [Pyrinomonadaceae bacterium]